jgi:hypothetical protein
MSGNNILLLGAVAYDPKVVTIWDGFGRYFAKHGLEFDYVLYSNYERQVEAHFSGDIHVAWNSPLAWLQSERIAEALGGRAEAICMRDTDRDLTSVVIVRSDSGIRDIGGLKGKRVAVGAQDSPLRYSRSTGWSASTEIISGASAMRCAPWFAARLMRPALLMAITSCLARKERFHPARHGSWPAPLLTITAILRFWKTLQPNW